MCAQSKIKPTDIILETDLIPIATSIKDSDRVSPTLKPMGVM